MKDITDKKLEKLYEYEMSNNLHLVVNGIEYKIPDHVIKFMYKNWEFYEAKNIADIVQNYSIRKNKMCIPFRMIKFAASMGIKSMSRKERDVYSELQKQFDTTRKFLIGDDKKWTFLLTRRINAPVYVVISDVRLEDFKTYNNPLFKIHTFMIVDVQGNKMPCVYEEFYYMTKNIHNPTRIPIDFDAIKNGDRAATWMVTASLLDENVTHKTSGQKRGMCLHISNIQSGGKRNTPDMPVLTI